MMDTILEWSLGGLSAYGIPALLLLCYAGSLGIPFPITPVVLAAGALVRAGLLEWQLVLLACLAGASLADQSEYLLGRLAQPWLKRHFGQKLLWQQADSTLGRQGDLAVVLTRFWLTPLAPTVNVISGGRTPYLRFLAFDVLGELLWVILYGGLGYLFAAQWEAVSETMGQISAVSIGALAALAAVYLLFFRRDKLLPALQRRI